MPTLRLRPDLEESLRQIPGVRAVSVVTGPDAAPTEIHILAAPGKPAKAVVRDVQSLALAAFDLDIDHRIVSVVQIADGETALAPGAIADAPDDRDDEDAMAPASPRPIVSSIMLRQAGTESEAQVVLNLGTDTFTGTSSGPAGNLNRHRLIARATLQAAAPLLGMGCELEATQVVDVGGREVAVSVLALQVPRYGELVVSGSAPVRGDASDAVARSVLDALNRRLAG